MWYEIIMNKIWICCDKYNTKNSDIPHHIISKYSGKNNKQKQNEYRTMCVSGTQITCVKWIYGQHSIRFMFVLILSSCPTFTLALLFSFIFTQSTMCLWSGSLFAHYEIESHRSSKNIYTVTICCLLRQIKRKSPWNKYIYLQDLIVVYQLIYGSKIQPVQAYQDHIPISTHNECVYLSVVKCPRFTNWTASIHEDKYRKYRNVCILTVFFVEKTLKWNSMCQCTVWMDASKRNGGASHNTLTHTQ